MIRRSAPVEWVRIVAERLGDLTGDVVFLGGATVDLLITDPAAAVARPTKDVDVIVEVGSWVEYTRLQERLRAQGFREDTDEGAPLCRWVIDDIKVDVMPTSESILGFANRWYEPAMRAAAPLRLSDTVTIRLTTAPYFVATKLEAFTSRGEDDYQLSPDIEDVVAVVDGRLELADEIANADEEVRRFLQERIAELLSADELLDALPGHLPGDAASQARLPEVIARLERIAATRLG